MAALGTGVKAPDFELKSLYGKPVSLSEELSRGAVVLAFFKVSCPTCQYAFPFLERLHKAYGNSTGGGQPQGLKPASDGDADAALKGRSSTNVPSIGVSSMGGSSTGTPSTGASSTGVGPAGTVSLIGISQNDAKETAAFIKEFGITFPVLLDDTRSYAVSNAYGLTNVPSIFYVAQDGETEVSSVGWMKTDFEDISRRMAEAGRIAPAVMFRPGEDVRDFQAG
jgi:peroxiredoxin